MNPPRPVPLPGPHEAEFWSFTAQRQLRLQACNDCGSLRYPPASACPDCLSLDASWRLLSGRGHIVSATVFRRAYFKEMPAPYTVVSVETEEGPLLIGNLLDPPDDIPIDAPVIIDFEAVTCADETLILPQWRLEETDSATEHQTRSRPA